MFPIHAKCVTFDAGYDLERKRATAILKLGEVYTILRLEVGRSSSTLEFYEIEGKWNTVFFDAAPWNEVFDLGRRGRASSDDLRGVPGARAPAVSQRSRLDWWYCYLH